MRYLGIDYGEKRIGYAASDEQGSIAFPRETLRNDSVLFEQLVRIIEEERIGAIVVGDTRAFGGAANTVTAEAEAFMAKLRDETGLPVHAAWEAGSSIVASGETGIHDDAKAAAIILQRFLDMHPAQ